MVGRGGISRLCGYGGALNFESGGGSNCGKCRRATKGGLKIRPLLARKFNIAPEN